MNLAVAVPWHERLQAVLELGKIRLASLAILTLAAGMILGHARSGQGSPELMVLLWTSFGSLLVAAGGNGLNQYFERDLDSLMLRTRQRPLPTGRLTPAQVLITAIATVLLGLVLTGLASNWLAAALNLTICVLYVFVYTPLKRLTHWNTLVGAIPGGLPPVVGHAAATGTIDLEAWILFAIVFVWQLPHFLAIAWRHRDDYARAGFRMLSVTRPDDGALRRQMLGYTAMLLLVSLLPRAAGMAGSAYLIGAVLLWLGFGASVLGAVRRPSEPTMRRCFQASILYLGLLFLVLILDRGVPG